MTIYPIKGLRVDGTVTFVYVKNVAISFGYRYYCPPPKELILKRLFETIEYRLHSGFAITYDVITNILTDILKSNKPLGIHKGKPINVLTWLNGSK